MVSISEDRHFKIWTDELEVFFDNRFDHILTDLVLCKDYQGSDVMMLSNLNGSIEAFNIMSSSSRPGVVKLYEECVVGIQSHLDSMFDGDWRCLRKSRCSGGR